ncbi:hypothetical protein ABW20_dc0105699 [Dactylellina cionopaga]|nr:hypothetical protein ABW20_dc0105699 [Dactylellina cionopaga]
MPPQLIRPKEYPHQERKSGVEEEEDEDEAEIEEGSLHNLQVFGEQKTSEDSGSEDYQLDIRVDISVGASVGNTQSQVGVEADKWDGAADTNQAITDDEKLARLLQAQEDGFEIPEDGGSDSDDDDEVFDDEYLLNMMAGNPNNHGRYPRASKLANAYDDFDIMDRGRASLSRPSKRQARQGKLEQLSKDFETMEMGNSDEELHAKLENYISRDRERKRLRKQERELQQSRILGKSITHTESASMDARGLVDGMPLQYLHIIIKQFIMNGAAERLSLTPMPKNDRLQVHNVAHRFFMTSKSQGKGNNRFPVLYKTKRTSLFEGDEKAIDDVFKTSSSRSSRGRLGVFRGKSGRGQQNAGGNNILHKDGMIVGTGAAEIGQGNKGYEMLAKMGWTTGTGLGSNRTGILDPVQAIVKNSRSGLG